MRSRNVGRQWLQTRRDVSIRYLYACDTIRATGLRLFQILFSSSKDAKAVKTKKKDEQKARLLGETREDGG